MPQVEVFTPSGVLSGAATGPTVGSDAEGAPEPLTVDAARWQPLDGTPLQQVGSMTVDPDDILVLVLAAPSPTVHAGWYPIELDVGPYHLAGRLPTAPGFDPARALARPSGAFVALRDVAISMRGRPEAGVAERPWAQVNRYAVEGVASNLMLGFFFPGARLEPLRDRADGLPVPMPARQAKSA